MTRRQPLACKLVVGQCWPSALSPGQILRCGVGNFDAHTRGLPQRARLVLGDQVAYVLQQAGGGAGSEGRSRDRYRRRDMDGLDARRRVEWWAEATRERCLAVPCMMRLEGILRETSTGGGI